MTGKAHRIRRKLKSFMPSLRGKANVTFSQYGEDIIMLRMLERYHVTNITYLDIGANDPVNGSNTYNFYLRGYRGVLVEPNAALAKKIRKVRRADTCLNCGIGIGNIQEADYYMFPEAHSPMNTFSKEDAELYEQQGIKLERVVKVPLKDVNEVIAENFKEDPTIVSVDVEGLDEAILSRLDYSKHQPLLICVETVKYSKYGEFEKRTSILDLMASKGYFIYADTHVNTIFCHRKKFEALLK